GPRRPRRPTFPRAPAPAQPHPGQATRVDSSCPGCAIVLDQTRFDPSRTNLGTKGHAMIPLDLGGKTALVTGVGDNVGFAWHIAKALQAAGARLLFAVHPRLMKIVETILQSDREDDVASRVLGFNAGTLKVEKLLPCDVEHDTMADVPQEKRADKRYSRHGDFSIQGLIEGVKTVSPSLDILIHSIAFSPEIKNAAVDTSRSAYLTALSVSAYSL